MQNIDYDGIRKNRIERLVIIVFTIYAIGTYIVAYGTSRQWLVYIIEALIIIAWGMHIFKFGDYNTRAKIATLLSEGYLTLYSLTAPNANGILFACIGLTVVIGLYEMPRLLWLPGISSAIIIIYNTFWTGSISFLTHSERIRSISQIGAIYLTIFVMRFFINEEHKTKIRLLESIEELKLTQHAKDDFLANVSHELRTPINTICGMSEIMLSENIPVTLHDSVHNIDMAGKNLLTVVTDILDFSEIQSGKAELSEDTYNISSTMADVIDLVLAKKAGKNLEFFVDFDINIPCQLYGDEEKIKRVMLALLDNAVKFTEKGYISLNVGYRKEEYGINLCVTVSDTGIGIKKENLDRIFSDFSQVDDKRSRLVGGTGLGLTIAKYNVELLGGFISVDSTYGEGTTIKFVVPQKIKDDMPVAGLTDPETVSFAAYINTDRFNDPEVKRNYRDIIQRMAMQIGVKSYGCRTLDDLKHRVKTNNITHIFSSVAEYLEDKAFFDEMSKTMEVVLYLSPGEERHIENTRIHQLYRPLFIIPVINMLNGAAENVSMRNRISGLRGSIMPDAHILVVDDSVMNVKVLEGLLSQYKLKLTTANSGKEALEKIVSKSYDFVFMDHMMPEMDGIECMKRIRSMESAYYENVPIIALTANAVAGMREMFLSEGFDDFVAKPVEMSAIERVLLKYIPSEKIISAPTPATNASEGAASEEYTGSGDSELVVGDLDVNMGLLYCGGRENYLSILRMHIQKGADNLNQIEHAYDSEDWDNYTILVHALKSSMMSIGAVNLSGMAKALEKAGRIGDVDFIRNNHFAMSLEVKRVLDEIRNSKFVTVEKEEKVDVSGLKEITAEEFDGYVKAFEDAAYTFVGENMIAVLEKMEGSQFAGESLDKDLKAIRRKVDMSDYMSAYDALVVMRDKYRENR